MSSDTKFRVRQHVRWNWGNGTGNGQISRRFEEKVTRTIKGEQVTRNGSPDDPAYLIEMPDGGWVLKLGSELRPGG